MGGFTKEHDGFMHSTSNFMVVWMTKKHLKEHWFEGRG